MNTRYSQINNHAEEIADLERRIAELKHSSSTQFRALPRLPDVVRTARDECDAANKLYVETLRKFSDVLQRVAETMGTGPFSDEGHAVRIIQRGRSFHLRTMA